MPLQEAPYDMMQMAVPRRGENPDDSLYVQFGMFSKLNTEKSAQAGRPIYEDMEYITIIVPGDATSIIHRPVWAMDKQRWPHLYAAFKANKDQVAASGTPVKACGFLTDAQCRELEYFHVTTVEQLANLPDANAGNFVGIQELKRKAKDFLAAASQVAPLTAMRSELEGRDKQLATQSEQIAQLQAQLQQLLKEKAEAKED